jgi:heterotetrameric sarcosine oxidase beta subunit
MTRYSALALLKAGLTGQRNWDRAWRDPEPKKSYDIIIIGGGGHGLSTAYYLAKHHGVKSIAVLEKGWIGGGNTGRNTTIVRSNYRQPELHNLFEFSLKLWETMRGALILGHSDSDMVQLAQRGDALRCDGIDAELMSRAEVARFVPLLDMSLHARFPIAGGMIQRRGGTARHDAVAWGYARAADALGVDIIQNCDVTGLAISGGRITGVETSRGGISADRVAICVAGNSGPLAAMAGIKLPVEAQTLQAFVTEAVKPMIDTVIMSHSLHCYISQSDKGGIVLGGDPDQFPSYAQRGLHPRLEKAAAEALALVPALARLRMVRCWSGTTDMSFDGSPIISALPVDGLYLNGGWCYGGFKATPGSGAAYAQLLGTGQPHPLAAAFTLDRFARGATIDEAGVGPMPQLR